MRQIWIPRYGDPSVLELREAADPEPAKGEVRVKVAAAGVNFADLSARMGTYPDAPPRPFVPGYEVSGVIDAVGEGVDAARIGERVMSLVRFGGYTTHRCVLAEQVVRVPDSLDLVTAAAVPTVYITAWMMLEVMGRPRAGDRVLVHSAGGGVGLAALDLLKWRGATAIGTASPRKHEFLRARGFDEIYDYDALEAGLAGKPGLDLILDAVGGSSWGRGLSLLRAGGRLICFGFSAPATGDKRNLFATLSSLVAVPWLKTNPIALINENKGVMGVNMGRLWDEAERARGWLLELTALWEQGVVRPLVHAQVPFDNAKEAHRILHDRENLGKVLLIP
jgi:NADPH:quinone reductase-like Zn-dependent oxidoreductase